MTPTTEKISVTSLKVGDRVFLARSGSWDTRFSPGTVDHITPSGMVDVRFGLGPKGSTDIKPIRFRTNGQRLGSEAYRDWYIDTLPFEQRRALLEQEDRTRTAVAAFHSIKVQGGINLRWGREGLMQELDRLQGLIDAARKVVEEI